MKTIQYGIIARLTKPIPCDGAGSGVGRIIDDGEQVTVGNAAGPEAWWVQTTDGRKGVAFVEELEAV